MSVFIVNTNPNAATIGYTRGTGSQHIDAFGVECAPHMSASAKPFVLFARQIAQPVFGDAAPN
jgi:hypothetical protein